MKPYVIRYVDATLADAGLTPEDLEAAAKDRDRPALYADGAALLGVGPETRVGFVRAAVLRGCPLALTFLTLWGPGTDYADFYARLLGHAAIREDPR